MSKSIAKKNRAKKDDDRDLLFDLSISQHEMNVAIDERESRFTITIKASDSFKEGNEATGVTLQIDFFDAEREQLLTLGEHTSVELVLNKQGTEQRTVVMNRSTTGDIELGSFKKSTVVHVDGIIRTGHFHYAFVTNNQEMRVDDDIAPSELPSNDEREYGMVLKINYKALQVVTPAAGGSEAQPIIIHVQED